MQYVLIVFDDPAEEARITAGHRAFTERIVKTGNFRAGGALAPATTATTIRLRGGKRTVIDGPVAETSEQMVGYYLVEARDLDEALGLAEGIPSARYGAVEVRPVLRGPQPG
jgi:hypothetical protein